MDWMPIDALKAPSFSYGEVQLSENMKEAAFVYRMLTEEQKACLQFMKALELCKDEFVINLRQEDDE